MDFYAEATVQWQAIVMAGVFAMFAMTLNVYFAVRLIGMYLGRMRRRD